ncbi:MAG: (2Fe-2S)-binding protein [Candidatus Thermoplasmatota archaeon]|nr:(2Fe-2S)-binding protein [Candidatus Thermoplasmatota archaeon]
MKKRTIVCRCEDLSEEEVITAIDEGYTDIEELRKRLRIGMGPCQGRVCIQLVMKILEKKTGKKVTMLPTARPPTVPVSLGTLAEDEHET